MRSLHFIAIVAVMVFGFTQMSLAADHTDTTQTKIKKQAEVYDSRAAGSPKQTAEQKKIIAEYDAANAKMHAGMNVELTGDADRDFVVGMIPHHQGAIDMAKVVLEYGHDEKIKTLAQGIIKAQESEIAMMQSWLKSYDAKKSKM